MKALQIASTALALYAAGRLFSNSRRRFDFRDKLVLVTGGSRGLGLILARKLIDRGARVAICARDGEKLEYAARDLEQRAKTDVTRKVFYKVCDVTRPRHVEELLDSVRAWGGPIDALINNAGVITAGPIDCMQREDFEASLGTYFWGPLNLILGVLPDMRARGQGRIINIASFGGLVSVPHLVPYCAGKHALVGLSHGLRSELVKQGIYITTVCPGMIRTGSHVNAKFKGRYRSEQTWFSVLNSNPLLSANAVRAAEKILRASEYGRASLILTLSAKLMAVGARLAPELVSDVLATADTMLPESPLPTTTAKSGRRSRTLLSPSILTALSDRAVARNNE